MMEPLPEDLLSAYADGECTAEERVAIDARLSRDAEWRAILDEIREMRAAVRALPIREPPAGFLDALTARRTRRPAGLVAAVAAAAAVAMAYLIASPSDSDNAVTPAIATLAESHGAAESLHSDPVSSLAPMAVSVNLEP
jgi:anti-sigma factor RsiW